MTNNLLDLNKFIEPWKNFLTDKQKEQLEEENSCSICIEVYKNPVITNCTHLFCKSCIEAHSAKSDSCPLCRQKITLLKAEPLDITALVKKNLGLGSTPTALDAIHTPEQQTQYEQCRSKIQKHILESDCFGGPWCCGVPENLSDNVLFRLRHQLELRGFIIYGIFYLNHEIYLRVVGGENKTVSASEENAWNPNFTPKKVFELGKQRLINKTQSVDSKNLNEILFLLLGSW